MTVISNSLYLGVKPTGQLIGSGWEVRVRGGVNFTDELATIGEFIDLSVGPELCAPGAGSATFDADSPFWFSTLPNGQPATSLLDQEYVWEAYQDGLCRFQWLGTNIEERIIDDSETRGIVVSGPGTGEVLKWAVVMPKGYPTPPTPGPDITLDTGIILPGDIDPVGAWAFPPTTAAMTMWYTIFSEAQARGTLRFVDPTFTAAADSAGDSWDYIPDSLTGAGESHPITLGTNMLEFLDTCTGQRPDDQFAAHAEWVMRPGFQLDVRAFSSINADSAIGSHREKNVIFYEGNIISTSRTRIRDQVANYVVVCNFKGDTSRAVDTGAVAKWNQREYLDNNNSINLADPLLRDRLAQLHLAQFKDEKSEWVIQVPYGQDGRQPFIDYDLGDWIGISSFGSNGVSKIDAYRVMAIVVNIADDTPTVELTLQTRLELRQRQLERQILAVERQVDSLPAINVPSSPPVANTPLGYQPDGSLGPVDPVDLGNLINTAAGGAGDLGGFGGIGGGVRMFIQNTDPGSEARPGDLWYQAPGIGSNPTPTPDPSPDETPVRVIDAGHGNFRIPGTDVLFN